MSHLVLSRKYRPQRFEDLVGQEAVARTLAQAIRSGRIGHAYLFIGPRGTGKTTTARIFAKALNCEKGPTPQPCGACDSCRGIASGSDLDVVEMDAASNNGVEDVRALRDSVGYRPARSRFRVWIVDEVHMLSTAAFNAFLKTLEEPPPQAKFLFCTTEAHKLPETFLSRVQRLEFRRIDEGRMADRLRELVEREGLAVEAGVCDRIAAGALGGLRDAESLLEQLLSCAREGRVTLADLDAVQGRAPVARVRAFFDAVQAGDAAAALDAAEACLGEGSKPDVVLDQWIEDLRGLLVTAARGTGAPGAGARGAGAPSAVPTSGGAAEDDAARARAFGLPRIARSIDLLLEKRRHLREGADGRLVAEVAAVELARLPSARDLDALIDALRADAPAGSWPAAAGSWPAAAGSWPAAAGSWPAAAGRGAAGAPPFAAGNSPSAGGARPVPTPAPTPARPVTAAPSPAAPSAAPSAAARVAEVAAAGGCATRAAAAPSLEEVTGRWADLVRSAGRSRLLGSALVRASAVAVTGDAIVIALPETDTVARGTLRSREAAEAFRESAREVFGVPLRIVVEEGSRAAPTGSSPAASPPAASPPGLPPSAAAPPPPATAPPSVARAGATLDEVRSHPQVKALLDVFGARVLAVQRVAESPPRRAEDPA